MRLNYFKKKTRGIHVAVCRHEKNARMNEWVNVWMHAGWRPCEQCRSSPLWCFLGGCWGSWERRKWIHCPSLHHTAGGQWSLPVSTGCPRKGLCCPHRQTSQGWGSSSPSGTAVDQREGTCSNFTAPETFSSQLKQVIEGESKKAKLDMDQH